MKVLSLLEGFYESFTLFFNYIESFLMGLGGNVPDGGAHHYKWFDLNDDTAPSPIEGLGTYHSNVVLLPNKKENKKRYPYYPFLAETYLPISRTESDETQRLNQTKRQSKPKDEVATLKSKVIPAIAQRETVSVSKQNRNPTPVQTKQSQGKVSEVRIAPKIDATEEKIDQKAEIESGKLTPPPVWHPILTAKQLKAKSRKTLAKKHKRLEKKNKSNAILRVTLLKQKQVKDLKLIWDPKKRKRVLLIDADNFTAGADELKIYLKALLYLSSEADYAFLAGQGPQVNYVRQFLDESKMSITIVDAGKNVADDFLLNSALALKVTPSERFDFVVGSNDHIFRKLGLGGRLTILSPNVFQMSLDLMHSAHGIFDMKRLGLTGIPSNI